MLREYWAHITSVSQFSGNNVVGFEDSRGRQQRSEHSTHLHTHIISPGAKEISAHERLGSSDGCWTMRLRSCSLINDVGPRIVEKREQVVDGLPIFLWTGSRFHLWDRLNQS